MEVTYRLTNATPNNLSYLVKYLRSNGFQSIPLLPAHTEDERDVFVYSMINCNDRSLSLVFNARSVSTTCDLQLTGNYDDGFDIDLRKFMEDRHIGIEVLRGE